MLKGNPFAMTDFSTGAPQGLGGPVDPGTGVTSPPTPVQPPTPVRFPDITPGSDPVQMYQQLTKAYNDYMAQPGVTDTAMFDPSVKALTDAIEKSAIAISTDALARKTAAEQDQRAKEIAQLNAHKALEAARISADRALQAAGISAGATLGAAGMSAGASQFSAEEATRRAMAEGQMTAEEAAKLREFTAGQAEKTQTFTAGENAANRANTLENTTLSNTLAGQRESAQRTFEAEQNALNRKIEEVKNDIAVGNLNLNTGLGILQKWLEAQPYSLPKGAQYVPGFQPGGGVQEAARLAGVSYNPANYKANTVPFNPAEVVRQTMGR